MRIRNAFTMLELIFVIVVMGIIGKFGTEFLAQSYNSFIFSKINNTLQSDSAIAVEFIAARLQHRIKDSVIARKGSTSAVFALADASGEDFKVIEWVASDIENFRGLNRPNWSGIIDLDRGIVTGNLFSPDTNTSAIDETIQKLSHGDSYIDDAALFFIGANTDINGYGWQGTPAITDQTGVMHPIDSVTGDLTQFAPNGGDFTGIDVFEYYKLAWTANAIAMEDFNATTKIGNLVFYFDYQPWKGEKYTDGKGFTIMENVSTFQYMALGSVIKIQVCTKSMIINGDDNGTQGYSLCKEKTIF